MSNPLAVATVTAALVTLVQSAVDALGLTPGPLVSASSLADSGDHGRVSVHLYRVSRHDALSNEPLPLRSSDGALRARPTVALDLHYLVCFRADTDLDAQSMLAVSAVTLEANPRLDPDLLALTEADHPQVVGNDLGDGPAWVRWTSDSLSVDELTKLWALYSAGEFGLSLAVSPGRCWSRRRPCPRSGCRSGRSGWARDRSPRCGSTQSAGPTDPPPRRARVPHAGSRPARCGVPPRGGSTTVVVLDGAEVSPTATDAQVAVPGTGLLPGSHRVQVRTYGPPLDPDLSATPTVATSETRAVLVVPTLAAVAHAGDTVTATVQPSLSAGRRVRLLMDPTAGGVSVGCRPTRCRPRARRRRCSTSPTSMPGPTA